MTSQICQSRLEATTPAHNLAERLPAFSVSAAVLLGLHKSVFRRPAPLPMAFQAALSSAQLTLHNPCGSRNATSRVIVIVTTRRVMVVPLREHIRPSLRPSSYASRHNRAVTPPSYSAIGPLGRASSLSYERCGRNAMTFGVDLVEKEAKTISKKTGQR